jgi:hypothetical protein
MGQTVLLSIFFKETATLPGLSNQNKLSSSVLGVINNFLFKKQPLKFRREFRGPLGQRNLCVFVSVESFKKDACIFFRHKLICAFH